MASVFVIRIPGWRTFVFTIPENWNSYHLNHWFRRTIRSRLFQEIELGNHQAALQLAQPWRLRYLRGEWGESAVRCAIGYNQSALAVELVRRGGMYAEDGTLALAAMNGDLTVVEALLSAGKHPDEPFKDPLYHGMTPLMWAASRHHPEIMERLLQAGADIDAVDRHGRSAARHVTTLGGTSLEALKVLLRHKPEILWTEMWSGIDVLNAVRRYRDNRDPDALQFMTRKFPELDMDQYLDS